MNTSTTARRSPIFLALTLLAMHLACTRSEPEERLEHPTAERLAARPNAVGVPYDRYVLLRYREELFALKIRALPGIGDRVAYDWYCADPGSDFTPSENLRQGHGETFERPYSGRISVPDGPSLEWSRGSTRSGWLYWPQQGPQVEAFSRAFVDLETIDPRADGGRWLERPNVR